MCAIGSGVCIKMRLQAGTGIVSFQVGSASGIGSSNAYNVAHACDADARSPFGRALGRVGFLEWGVHSIHVIHFRTLDSIGIFSCINHSKCAISLQTASTYVPNLLP